MASINSSELFVATTLFVVLGTSLLTQIGGLSLAMGAFIAGLLVAETQYQNQVEDNIMPFKGLLMGLFFMTVGMTINPNTIIDKIYIVIAASAGLIILKALIITGLAKLFKFNWGAAINAGLLLAQGSEFAFILFGLASQQHIAIIDHDTAQILLTIVTITMALTPALSKLGDLLYKRAESRIMDEDSVAELPSASDLTRHVVIAGFGRVGEMVARLLSAKKVNYVVIEADAKRAKDARKQGFPVHHGDASKLHCLRAVGIERAKATIITIDQNIYLKKTIRTINKAYPDLPIVVRSVDLSNFKSLEKVGATIVVPEKYEAGLQMAGALLKAIGVTEYEVSRLKNQFRAGNYKIAKEVIPINKDS
jgi:CPA2 family monovalent cation:H+ antiporter-2